ncbi:MAG: hypothetical protein QW815_09310 [Nitrososphaerota archaeon]
MKVRKYVRRGTHPLAPFTIEIEASSVIEALLELREALDLVARDAATAASEAARREERVARNPVNCALAEEFKEVYVCTSAPGEPKVWKKPVSREGDDPVCASCRKFKPRQ